MEKETIEMLKRKKEKSQKTWAIGYGHFSKIINQFDLKTGAEIGVAFGGHSEAILKNTHVTKLYGIDPYQHTPGYIDAMNFPQEAFDELYITTTKHLAQFGNRYKHIRKYSDDATKEIPEQIDFVYIDADHSYEGVWKDLCTWFPRIREGGIIGGHDYLHPTFPGVQKAIDEFFGRFKWKVHYEGDNVWWVQKEKLSISFFIPAYNCERTVSESVKSIIETNLQDGDEIIITDDYSTDNTAKVLKDLAEKYSCIKILTHMRNKGGATARNTAIEQAKNEILFCLDSDNILASGSIEPLKQYLLNTGADATAFGWTYFFGDRTDVIHKKVEFVSGKVTIEDCFSGKSTPPPSGNYMFTKSSWLTAGGYPDGNWLDTWGFGIRQLFAGAKMHTLPDTFYFHRRGHESYYIREAKKLPVSLTALQILIPYFDRFSKQSIQYMMGSGKYTWYDNLAKKPIKLTSTRTLQDTRDLIKNKIKISFPKLYGVYLQIRSYILSRAK